MEFTSFHSFPESLTSNLTLAGWISAELETVLTSK